MSKNEHLIQVSIVRFLDVALPAGALYFAVPNGGHLVAKERTGTSGKTFRVSAAALKLKREGQKNGVADIIVIDPRAAGPCVIGLEVKAPKGALSEHQKAWRVSLQSAGGHYAVVRSIEEAAAALQGYGVRLRAMPSTAPGRLYEHSGGEA